MNKLFIGFAIMFLPAIWIAEIIAIPISWILDRWDEYKNENNR